jgi:hypothetical protein
MQIFVFSYLQEPINDVLHYRTNLIFRHTPFLFQKGAEITFVAKFGNNIAMGRFPDDVKAFEDIGMFEFGKSFNLAI